MCVFLALVQCGVFFYINYFSQCDFQSLWLQDIPFESVKTHAIASMTTVTYFVTWVAKQAWGDLPFSAFWKSTYYKKYRNVSVVFASKYLYMEMLLSTFCIGSLLK